MFKTYSPGVYFFAPHSAADLGIPTPSLPFTVVLSLREVHGSSLDHTYPDDPYLTSVPVNVTLFEKKKKVFADVVKLKILK